MGLQTVVVGLAVLAWSVVAFQTWTIYQLLNKHSRALLDQDEMRKRLLAEETRLRELQSQIQALAASIQPPAPQQPQGLPLGAEAPDFALPDLTGRERSLKEFLDRPTVVTFFSTTCGFCQRMAPRLGELPAEGPRVLLVSRGDADEHLKLAAENKWKCDVLLEPGTEVMNKYQATGTPTGYLVSREGKIASNLAVGADALLDLVKAVSPEGNGNGHADDLSAEALDEKVGAVQERARNAGLSVRSSTLNRQGLAAGTPAPEFELPDLSGKKHRLSDFRGKEVLLVFSDPNCGPCNALAPELKKLDQEKNGDLEVVMISRGDPNENRAKAMQHGYDFPVLLQKQWEISKDYAMFATPIGYLIDENGVIKKDVAVGKNAILELV